MSVSTLLGLALAWLLQYIWSTYKPPSGGRPLADSSRRNFWNMNLFIWSGERSRRKGNFFLCDNLWLALHCRQLAGRHVLPCVVVAFAEGLIFGTFSLPRAFGTLDLSNRLRPNYLRFMAFYAGLTLPLARGLIYTAFAVVPLGGFFH